MLKQRVITALVLLPIVLGAVFGLDRLPLLLSPGFSLRSRAGNGLP